MEVMARAGLKGAQKLTPLYVAEKMPSATVLAAAMVRGDRVLKFRRSGAVAPET